MKPELLTFYQEQLAPGEFTWRLKKENDPRYLFEAYSLTMMIKVKILLQDLGHIVRVVD